MHFFQPIQDDCMICSGCIFLLLVPGDHLSWLWVLNGGGGGQLFKGKTLSFENVIHAPPFLSENLDPRSTDTMPSA